MKEPAVQAHQHQSSKNNFYFAVRRQHSSTHIAPMEMGMYIILATFSFAIIVFVVSCIVYASKYKPRSLDFQDDNDDKSYISGGYKLLGNSYGNNSSKQSSQLKENTTTNVHDWVWLGRATLERASGLLVPSININDKIRRKKNDNWIRIRSNPTCVPESNSITDLNANNNDNGKEKFNGLKIDNTTFRKKNRIDFCQENGKTKPIETAQRK